MGKLTIATFLCLLCSIILKGLRIMRYKDLRFWDKLSKNCRFFFTSKMKESLHPLAKNLLIPLTPEKISAPVDSPPKKNFAPSHYIIISMLWPNKNFILSCGHSCCAIFILIWYSSYIQVMLTLILSSLCTECCF